MKTIKITATTVLVLAAIFTFSLSQALAEGHQDDVVIQEFVSLSAGSEEEINFYIDDAFDMSKFGPMAVFIVMATGNSGTLSIEMLIDPDEELDLDFADLIEGMLIGIGYSLEPAFTFISGDSVEMAVNSEFGFAIFGAIIQTKETLEPLHQAIPCRLVFELSELEEEE